MGMGEVLVSAGAGFAGAVVGAGAAIVGGRSTAKITAAEARQDRRAEQASQLYTDIALWAMRCRDWSAKTAAGFAVEYPRARWAEWADELHARVQVSPDIPPEVRSTFAEFSLAVLEHWEQVAGLDLPPPRGVGSVVFNHDQFPAALRIRELSSKLTAQLVDEQRCGG
ncbi:MAG TPA: hypothetical protein PK623_02645 [Microthrixaceae bacterium]|nr:hypothetical protein [Microthrixaceae bacterium]HNJ22550.1 hypothetical protein [Microthrixaceae bacterium]HNK36527.1 hypothetical protein [Microthrixaceae bacterium]HNL47957.1 hypothetical protein [Microthrixaceae bacterium]